MSVAAYDLNPKLSYFECIKCAHRDEIADYLEGCPKCQSDGQAAAMRPAYERLEIASSEEAYPRNRFRSWMSYLSHPYIGQGDTPLVSLPTVAAEIGVRKLAAKIEGANPTGSHKDRMSALVVARALDIGASEVVAASSGNAGVSLAAFAGAASLECTIVTTQNMNPNWRRAIEMHGAKLVATRTVEERWVLVEEGVKNGRWYPATNFANPAVGSNPFGIDGYRSLAFELFEACGEELPSDICVPTSRADLLWGIARGFVDLREAGLIAFTPKVHAVEPFKRITHVLDGEDYRSIFPGSSKMVSLGGSTVTYQALDALNLCGGTAVAVREDTVIGDQKRLAKQGLYMETSSAAALTGAVALISRGLISAEASVVIVATSHGFKEFELFGELPIVG